MFASRLVQRLVTALLQVVEKAHVYDGVSEGPEFVERAADPFDVVTGAASQVNAGKLLDHLALRAVTLNRVPKLIGSGVAVIIHQSPKNAEEIILDTVPQVNDLANLSRMVAMSFSVTYDWSSGSLLSESFIGIFSHVGHPR